MGHKLEFMNCPNCGKRMTTIATLCRHCGETPVAASRMPSRLTASEDSDEFLEDSHMALEDGGYDSAEDDFDYDEFIENEFGNQGSRSKLHGVKLWVRITAWILLGLIIFSLLTVLITR
jgi:hypothetical protein